MGPLSTSWTDSSLSKLPNVPHDLLQEEMILKNTFMNAKMGPIAHYLGGTYANQTKSFLIRWPDEGGQAKLAHEIIEKPGVKSNHKVVKATQLKSNFKHGKSKDPIQHPPTVQ
jgi:hypothetical protein